MTSSNQTGSTALLLPLAPGSTVVVMSSGVAVDLVASPEYTPGSYLLTAAGLARLT